MCPPEELSNNAKYMTFSITVRDGLFWAFMIYLTCPGDVCPGSWLQMLDLRQKEEKREFRIYSLSLTTYCLEY